jgi:hypothetical protein
MDASSGRHGRSRRSIRVIGVGLLILGLLLISLGALYSLSGRNLGALWQRANHLVRAVIDRGTVTAEGRGAYTNVVFLHHSTGGALIAEGGVREILIEAGFDFWDHGYNPTGLRAPDGHLTGYSYSIPGDNTDPDGLARLFAQRTYPLPVNALSGLLQHEVIAFKSCFPASQIDTDAELAEYKAWYLGMRDVMDAHPDHVFIVMSPPPLHPAVTDPAAAARARAFAEWLSSDAYLEGHPNVYTFDLFDHLAEGDPTSPDVNTLRSEYRPAGTDSHPNQTANEAVGPAFAEAIMSAARSYAQGS